MRIAEVRMDCYFINPVDEVIIVSTVRLILAFLIPKSSGVIVLSYD